MVNDIEMCDDERSLKLVQCQSNMKVGLVLSNVRVDDTTRYPHWCVTKVDPSGMGAEIGIQEDDYIIQIHNVKVTIHDNIIQIIKKIKKEIDVYSMVLLTKNDNDDDDGNCSDTTAKHQNISKKQCLMTSDASTYSTASSNTTDSTNDYARLTRSNDSTSNTAANSMSMHSPVTLTVTQIKIEDDELINQNKETSSSSLTNNGMIEECYCKIKNVIHELVLFNFNENDRHKIIPEDHICYAIFQRACNDCNYYNVHKNKDKKITKDWMILPNTTAAATETIATNTTNTTAEMPLQDGYEQNPIWLLTRRYITLRVIEEYYTTKRTNTISQKNNNWLFSKKRMEQLFKKVFTTKLKPYLQTWNNSLNQKEILAYSQEIWNRFLLDHNHHYHHKNKQHITRNSNPMLQLYRLNETYVHVTASVLDYKSGKTNKLALPKPNIVNSQTWKQCISKVIESSTKIKNKMIPFFTSSSSTASNNKYDTTISYVVDKIYQRLRSNVVMLDEKNITVNGYFEHVVCTIMEDLEEDCCFLSHLNQLVCLVVKVRLSSMMPYLKQQNHIHNEPLVSDNHNDNDNISSKKTDSDSATYRRHKVSYIFLIPLILFYY